MKTSTGKKPTESYTRTGSIKADTIKMDSINSNTAIKRNLQKAVKEVEWKDLRQLTKFQVLYNLILPYPFLLLSWWFASQSLFIFACLGSYLFFASAFRQAHDGYHHSLGVGKRSTTAVLMILSVLLFTGLHSIRATHMQHHRDPLGEDDIEGSLAKLSWWQALIGGVRYRFAIYKKGMQLSSATNRFKAWIEFGLIGSSVMVIALAALLSVFPVNLFTGPDYSTYTVFTQIAVYHLTVMMLANSFVGLIAVWGVHHDIEDSIARTERNPIVNLLTFGLLYHIEHHLFPAVPTNNLPELAQRLDGTVPYLSKKRVVPTKHNILIFLENKRTKLKQRKADSDERHCPIRGLLT